MTSLSKKRYQFATAEITESPTTKGIYFSLLEPMITSKLCDQGSMMAISDTTAYPKERQGTRYWGKWEGRIPHNLVCLLINPKHTRIADLAISANTTCFKLSPRPLKNHTLFRTKLNWQSPINPYEPSPSPVLSLNENNKKKKKHSQREF